MCNASLFGKSSLTAVKEYTALQRHLFYVSHTHTQTCARFLLEWRRLRGVHTLWKGSQQGVVNNSRGSAAMPSRAHKGSALKLINWTVLVFAFLSCCRNTFNRLRKWINPKSENETDQWMCTLYDECVRCPQVIYDSNAGIKAANIIIIIIITVWYTMQMCGHDCCQNPAVTIISHYYRNWVQSLDIYIFCMIRNIRVAK